MPALGFYAMFVLQPLVLSFQYSFYDWNGVGVATWVGLDNYVKGLQRRRAAQRIFNAFKLIVFFSVIPVSLGLVTASVIRGAARGRFGTVSRTVLFLPQIIPLVAAGHHVELGPGEVGHGQPDPDRRRPRGRHQSLAWRLRLGACLPSG